MSVRLLHTKLFVPKPRPGSVPRQRLSERLDVGTGSKLTLVSAPAGFGKTTLLADWLATDGRPAAWLSLDRSDNDPTSFWAHVVAALQSTAPEVGASTLALLQEGQSPSTEALLTSLLNEVAALESDRVLVLDDYHVIESREVQDGVAFLLDHAAPNLHLVIASRADPALPLAGLRARGELVEVRAADLRFTSDEVAAYLVDAMGLSLSPQDVTALEDRTEGWIAALQLAALSMEGRDDVTEFITGFAGDDRYIVDYLVEEVVQRQPDRVQAFLFQTSVLGRLNAALCDAVTGGDDGKAMLETLDRANLFLVPLDTGRRWYRYHHLFADVLQARLLDEQPGSVPDLHRRASAWYEQADEITEAVEHALAAGDSDRAATLIETAAPALRRDRREATLRGWIERLPEELFRHRPVLAMSHVGSLMSTGEMAGVEARLAEVEQSLDAPENAVYADEEEFRRLPGQVAVHRAGEALMRDDVPATLTFASRALELAPADDHLSRGAGAALLGLARWREGDISAAHDGYVEAMDELHRAGHVADVLGCAITLADLRITQGRLGGALRAFEQSMQLASQGETVLRGTADMHVGMSTILLEWGDVDAARRHLARSQELGEHLGLPQHPHRWRIALARLKEIDRDLDAAVALLDEAERVYAGDFSPDVRPVAAMRARVRLRQGRLDDARGWARDRGLTLKDELSYLREFEHVTLARILLAGASPDEAAPLLERLLAAADEGGRTGSVIEILVLLALARQAGGDDEAALVALARALELAEPEGYVRVFIDEGPLMAALLEAAAGRGILPEYARRLASSTPNDADPGRPQALVDPLSERELDVLRLLGTELSGPAIARELVVSLNTVRSHTKSIYAKLGVNSRRAAMRRAEELELLRHR